MAVLVTNLVLLLLINFIWFDLIWNDLEWLVQLQTNAHLSKSFALDSANLVQMLRIISEMDFPTATALQILK